MYSHQPIKHELQPKPSQAVNSNNKSMNGSEACAFTGSASTHTITAHQSQDQQTCPRKKMLRGQLFQTQTVMRNETVNS